MHAPTWWPFGSPRAVTASGSRSKHSPWRRWPSSAPSRRSAADEYRAKGKFDVARIDEIEREVKHDVIAFLTSVAEHVGPESRFAHQGMTSSDVLDTCLAVQMARAAIFSSPAANASWRR
jgi:adenylosuccinate lyase